MDVVDKRQSQRKKVLRGGRIVLPNLMSTFACSVRNLSERGALLTVANSTNIPDAFYLIIDLRPGRRPCQVVWRKMNQLGVEFLDQS
jgi:hypothetical protein